MNPAMPPRADAHILIVDDNEVNVELLEDLLEGAGFSAVHSYTDPLQAEHHVHERCPDLILLDIRMPAISGLELMQRLQQRLGERMPAVIFLTAQIDERTRYEALSLGAQDFITKPFDHTEVLQRLNNALERCLLLREHSEKADELEKLVALRTAELQRQSREDPVTQLPNRRGVVEALSRQLTAAVPVAVLFVALDGMSDVARLQGYAQADQLALALSDRIVRLQDQMSLECGVWNSNEWVFLLPHWQGQDAESERISRVLSVLSEPLRVKALSLRLSPRVGLSASHGNESAEQLIRMAALALPDVPAVPRAYDAALEQELQRRQTLREALSQARGRQELTLFYQPKVDIANGRLSGAEALLRWHSETLGPVSPAEFIPAAERSGEILTIGEWVQAQALSQLRDWLQRGVVDENFSLAFNTSSVQLMQPDYAPRLVAQVEAAGVPPGMVEVEVTESGLMEDVELARSQLQYLAEAGITIAIDDFGTGYSSLAYLKTLPVSVLKIDRAFIRELHTQAQDRRLVETVIDMARHFRCGTVAEGVELPEQLKLLQSMGCGQVQGFLFAPPLKVSAFEQMAGLGFSHLFA